MERSITQPEGIDGARVPAVPGPQMGWEDQEDEAEEEADSFDRGVWGPRLWGIGLVVLCLVACVLGATSLVRMPVDLFPRINIPVVVVATFYSGMPPEQIETDITGRFERFFTKLN